MSRRPNRPAGFYDAIEYIGPRPQKPRRSRQNFFGGWVILLIAVGAAFIFGRPLVNSLKAEESVTSIENVDRSIARLSTSARFGERLAAAALQQTKTPVSYDDTYRQISYPNGDIPADKGKAEDVIIRGFRAVGTDLQQLVHEDMEKNFREYPSFASSTAPDTSIDHRRAANLKHFFERKGETLSTSRSPSEYLPGDVVILSHPGTHTSADGQIEMHIALIVPGPADHASEPWIVHNLDSSPKWENVLLGFQILGHYRLEH
jgi:uncharacterized protein